MEIKTPQIADEFRIVTGSINPVKIFAAKDAMSKVFINSKFEGLSVESKVSKQPKGEQETMTGAYNRALGVLKISQADIGVGIEGGVMETNVGMMMTAWCCIMDRKGKNSFGGGMNFHLPEEVAIKIRNGGELGPIMDELIHEENWKEKGGAVEVFTAGILNRTQAYTRLVELAMTRFVAPDYYKSK